ncbi:DUF4352 domain-containing protein [Streptomyces sp. NPDC048018]|uniref:DUF4352 domain-containing protein n=1 Tax=Streptomyces sp. NPDC048018 TaxID=3365499 RepID=UPI00371FD7A5
MRVRRAVEAVTAGAFAALLAACGPAPDSADGTAPRATSSASPSAASPSAAPSEAPSPSSEAPRVAELRIGETGRFEDREPNAGAGSAARTTFEVKAVGARYATPAEVGTSKRPTSGRYLVLTLSLKNVGAAAGTFASPGRMTWENEGTAAQKATTALSAGGPKLDTTYRPGQSVTGALVLEVGGRGGLVSYFAGKSEVPAFVVSLPSS